jgi:hypothetical protein
MAHHRAGQLIAIAPYVMSKSITNIASSSTRQITAGERDLRVDVLAVEASNMHYLTALQHSNANSLEIHFDLSKNYISLLRDKMEKGAAFHDTLLQVEHHLQAAVKGISTIMMTPADACKCFYRSVAMSEFNLLVSAALTPVESTKSKQQALEYTLEALSTQSLHENMDLHAFALGNLCKHLLTIDCGTSISSVLVLALGSRLLLVYSALINRNLLAYPASVDTVVDQASAATALLVSASCARVGWAKRGHNDEQYSAPDSYRATSFAWSSEIQLPTGIKSKIDSQHRSLHPASQNQLRIKPRYEKAAYDGVIRSELGREMLEKTAPLAPSGIRAPPPPKGVRPPPPKDSASKSIPQSEVIEDLQPVVVPVRVSAWECAAYAVSSFGNAFVKCVDDLIAIVTATAPILPMRKYANAYTFKGSDSCIFITALMLRSSRLEFMNLCHRLAVSHGAKFNHLLDKADKRAVEELRNLQAEVDVYPEQPPSVRQVDDLLMMTRKQLSSLFRNQGPSIRLVSRTEKILLSRVANKDSFLAQVSMLPAMSDKHASSLERIFTSASIGNKAVTIPDCVSMLDASFSGLEDYFKNNMDSNECLIAWHLPPVNPTPSQDSLMIVVIWSNKRTSGPVSNKDLLMKLLKSDVDALQIRYLIQNLMSSLSLRTRRRWSSSSDALRQLSVSLSLGEVLGLLPEHINALTICCPILLRAIPWHLLYIDVEEQGTDVSSHRLVELQVLDRYTVSLGSSLTFLEQSSQNSIALSHTQESYKLVCIDGGHGIGKTSLIDREGPSPSQLEVSCVSSLWSEDVIGDVKVIGEGRVTPTFLSTVAATSHNDKGYISNYLNPEIDDDLEEDEEMEYPVAKALLNCRVLHLIGCRTVGSRAALQLPQSIYTADDIISKLHLQNCGLCILSSYCVFSSGLPIEVVPESGMKLPNTDVPFELQSSFDLVDALHLAGAAATMHPLWDSSLGFDENEDPLGRYAHLLFMIKFYSELPKYSSYKSAACYAVRSTQLWLRDSTESQVIAFVSTMPIFKQLKDKIISDLKVYVRSHMTATYAQQYKRPGMVMDQSDPLDKEGNLFGHFFYYGPFVINGHGGNIHHPDLNTIPKQDTAKKRNSDDNENGVGLGQERESSPSEFDELTEDDFEYEIAALRAEGNGDRAAALELRRRQARLDVMKQSVSKLGLRWKQT